MKSRVDACRSYQVSASTVNAHDCGGRDGERLPISRTCVPRRVECPSAPTSPYGTVSHSLLWRRLRNLLTGCWWPASIDRTSPGFPPLSNVVTSCPFALSSLIETTGLREAQ